MAKPKLKIVAADRYEDHPLAALFPLLEGDEYRAFVEDVRANGLRELIIVHEGMILDGRNRYRACLEAGVQPRFRPYEGDDPLAEVISRNLKRRHLTESQRGMVAARIANLERTDTLRQGSRAANLPDGAVSQPDAAKLLNVSERTVRSARAVQDRGAPELRQAVDRGEIKLGAAAEVAKLPVARQRKLVAEGKQAVAAAAKESRKQRRASTGKAEPFDAKLAISRITHGVLSALADWPEEHREQQLLLADRLQEIADGIKRRIKR